MVYPRVLIFQQVWQRVAHVELASAKMNIFHTHKIARNGCVALRTCNVAKSQVSYLQTVYHVESGLRGGSERIPNHTQSESRDECAWLQLVLGQGSEPTLSASSGVQLTLKRGLVRGPKRDRWLERVFQVSERNLGFSKKF